MFEIVSDVPVPKPARPAAGRGRKYPFSTMAVDEMFFVPGKETNTLAPYAASVGAALGKKFVTRLMWMRETLEGWAPCDADDENAVQGIGCWRKE